MMPAYKTWRPSLCHPARRYVSRDLCRSCYQKWQAARAFVADPEKVRRRFREWARKNADVTYARNVERKYGMSALEHAAMAARQGGKCAICRGGPGARRFHVDHDHATGRVRGLLCFNCNRGIGSLGDDVHRVMAAANYLLRQEAKAQ